MESLKKIYPNVVVPQHGRGYFGIGIHCPKVTKNIGTLWRTAHILGADFMFIYPRCRFHVHHRKTVREYENRHTQELETCSASMGNSH